MLKTNPDNCERIALVSDPHSPVSLEEQLRACRAELDEQRSARERAVSALERSEGMFQSIVKALPMGVHLYHLEHHLFPAVPHTNWPRLAKRLDPHLAKAGVKPVVFWF